jgi:hypothetical protein
MRTLKELVRDTEPFPAAVIKKLPPRNEDYVPWFQYAQRLLAQHGGHSYRITHLEFGDGKWAVAVAVELAGETYGGVGIDASADAAESQAYKRACAHAGIGLHLYDNDKFWLHGKLQRDLAESEAAF